MIFIEIHSGLGNQLFQYAFGYATSKRLRSHLFVWQDQPEKPSALVRYFSLPYTSVPFKYGNHWLIAIYRRIKNRIRSHCTITNNSAVALTDINLVENAYYQGYFQSADFFRDYEHGLLRHLQIRSCYKQIFEQKYGELFRKTQTIVLHIRRGDYLFHKNPKDKDGGNITLPASYYREALSLFDLNEYQVIFTGDDIEWTKKHFADIRGALFEQNEEAIIDFQLLTHANVLVMSNGTFAWWGGRLNRIPNRRVIAPKNFIGYNSGILYPEGIESHTDFIWI